MSKPPPYPTPDVDHSLKAERIYDAAKEKYGDNFSAEDSARLKEVLYQQIGTRFSEIFHIVFKNAEAVNIKGLVTLKKPEDLRVWVADKGEMPVIHIKARNRPFTYDAYSGFNHINDLMLEYSERIDPKDRVYLFNHEHVAGNPKLGERALRNAFDFLNNGFLGGVCKPDNIARKPFLTPDYLLDFDQVAREALQKFIEEKDKKLEALTPPDQVEMNFGPSPVNYITGPGSITARITPATNITAGFGRGFSASGMGYRPYSLNYNPNLGHSKPSKDGDSDK